ncbi:DNA-directed RNA polymerase subunit B' [uncultured archaeon]|nr:DNA-directed RNA polymerase subunit B' [uncultured archaeon]
MIYKGDNQEDSAIINKSAAERGLFTGSFYKYDEYKLEKNQSFGNPNANTTKIDRNKNASFEKLVDGLPRVGTIINKGDAIIGVIETLTGDPKYKTIDRSRISTYDEPAVVDAIFKSDKQSEEQIRVVKLRFERPLIIGDKLSSTNGNKSICAEALSQSEMPFTEDGLTPDLIANPHSIPSRMTIGQIIETALAKVLSRHGKIDDGTAFRNVNCYEIVEKLKENGFKYTGNECLRNGDNGNFMDVSIFIGPTYEQRLQKFVLESKSVVADKTKLNPVTQQPLGGRSINGGRKLGEMEVWTFESHGNISMIYEKHHIDSDGKIMYVCRNCGNVGEYNEEKNIYTCRNCVENAHLVSIETTKAAHNLHQVINALGIDMRMYPEQLMFPSN